MLFMLTCFNSKTLNQKRLSMNARFLVEGEFFPNAKHRKVMRGISGFFSLASCSTMINKLSYG